MIGLLRIWYDLDSKMKRLDVRKNFMPQIINLRAFKSSVTIIHRILCAPSVIQLFDSTELIDVLHRPTFSLMSIYQQFQLGKTEYQMTIMVIWNKFSIIWILDTVYVQTVFIIYLKLSFNLYPVFLFAKSFKITVDSDCSHEIKRHLLLWT